MEFRSSARPGALQSKWFGGGKSPRTVTGRKSSGPAGGGGGGGAAGAHGAATTGRVNDHPRPRAAQLVSCVRAATWSPAAPPLPWPAQPAGIIRRPVALLCARLASAKGEYQQLDSCQRTRGAPCTRRDLASGAISPACCWWKRSQMADLVRREFVRDDHDDDERDWRPNQDDH